MDDSYWEELSGYMRDFVEIRNSEEIEPIYHGYSENGVRFDTDLNVFRVYTVNKEEFYKIPVAQKEEVSALLKGSIYTSFDFVKKYKTWDKVELVYGDKVKKVHKWKFDDLAYKMSSKRIVGKIQPIKSEERSDHNFTIKIVGKNYSVNINTMGEDYLKVYSEQGETYYEVPNALYKYLKEDIFKIKEEEKDK